MVGELKCEFDVSSQCVTEEWSFIFAHDAVKHLYAGMPRAGQRERHEAKTAITQLTLFLLLQQ